MSGKTNLGASVVPDLMRVYESLTQSSTPQDTTIPRGRRNDSNPLPTPKYAGDVDDIKDHNIYNSTDQSNFANIPHIQYNFYPTHHEHEDPTADPSFSGFTRASGSTRASTRKRHSEETSDASTSSTKVKRKKKDCDGRWTKRFAWPDELHRDFVSAIFDVGLKNSSPSAILEQMPNHADITTERIKSHLQKYRLHRSKHKDQFMESYDGALEKIQNGTMDSSSLEHAETAAFLTHSAIHEIDDDMGLHPPPDPNTLVQSGVLQLPQLSDVEKRSPVGASMGYLMGLFFSLKQQLINQRISNESSRERMDAVGSFSSFPDQHDQVKSSTYQISNQAHNHQDTHTISIGQPSTTSSESRATNPLMEENNMMKREMKSQMSFQTKMRKLKEQELNKYKTESSTSGAQIPYSSPLRPSSSATTHTLEQRNLRDVNNEVASPSGNVYRSTSDKKDRADSIENIGDDFWKSDEVLDDQLFEFLMND